MINSQYNQCPSHTLTPPPAPANRKQDYSSLTSPAVVFSCLHTTNNRQTQTDRRQEVQYDLSIFCGGLQSFRCLTTSPLLPPLTLNCTILSQQKLLFEKCLTSLFSLADTGLFCSFINLVKISDCPGSHILTLWTQALVAVNKTPSLKVITLLLCSTWECRTVPHLALSSRSAFIPMGKDSIKQRNPISARRKVNV